MLFSCPRAQEVWQGLGLQENVNAAIVMDRSGSIILEELLCSEKPGGIACDMDNRVATVMVASWYIWWSRRQIKNKEPVPNIVRTVLNIKGIVANNSKVKGSGNTIRRGGWTKPASGVYKLNVDAAYEPETGRGATGAIIRDSRGNFIAACCDHTDHAIDVATMEAIGLFNGLKLAEQFGAQSLAVESDSMEVVEAVRNPSDYRGTGAVIIDDCRHLLLVLGMATFMHCPREANEAAHALARHGYTQEVREFWFSDPPPFLDPVLISDRVIIL
jgi:hypothetical protein